MYTDEYPGYMFFGERSFTGFQGTSMPSLNYNYDTTYISSKYVSIDPNNTKKLRVDYSATSGGVLYNDVGLSNWLQNQTSPTDISDVQEPRISQETYMSITTKDFYVTPLNKPVPAKIHFLTDFATDQNYIKQVK